MRSAPTWVVALALALAPAALASVEESSRAYATLPVAWSAVGLGCRLCLPEASVGGAVFDVPPGRQAARLVVEDASGGPVEFTLCSDLDGNGVCWSRGEDHWSVCSASVNLAPWRASRVAVEFTTNRALGGCAVATTGTITLLTTPAP